MATDTTTSIALPLDPREYAKAPTPSLEEFEQLWASWDVVTRRMIPEEQLLTKPIHLRNCCLFYLGHIPAFLDRQVVRGTGDAATEPATFSTLFERGIDPDVDNPALCHAHSAVPDEWPALEEILKYQEDVRASVRTLYATGRPMKDRRIARSLWLGLEHEGLHLETLLYMLLQSDWILPPPSEPVPDFAALAAEARAKRMETTWVHIPQQQVVVGLDDPEDEDDMDDGPAGHFGWDNEKPKRTRTVPAFEASTRAITNGEYAQYMEACHVNKSPASWKVESNGDCANGVPMTNGTNGTTAKTNGVSNTNGISSNVVSPAFMVGKAVRTVYGPVPLEHALDWPVMASYDELQECAEWMHGRIPTQEEAQSIYAYVDALDSAPSTKSAHNIPAVNGHLSNDGVEETPPSRGGNKVAAAAASMDLFHDLRAANVGFRAFHPVPPTLLLDLNGKNGTLRPAGRAELGGVWEWTSTVFDSHDGFTPMSAYPAYSRDFFDGKHNVVLGGSWATHPRIAGRKSFVNWYQRNYPYAWCGARLVRDLPN